MALRAFAVLSSLVIASAQQSCYRMNGNLLPDTFRPCNSTADVSHCCNIGDGIDVGEICTTKGYCVGAGTFNGLLYMEGCTDSAGKSKDCLYNLCPNANNNWDGTGDAEEWWNIQICGIGIACCRSRGDLESAKSCCNNTDALIKNFNMGALMIPSKINSAVAITATITQQISTSPTPSSSQITSPTISSAPSSSAIPGSIVICNKDESAIIGVSIGAILGTALLASLVALFWMFLQQKRLKEKVALLKRSNALGYHDMLGPSTHYAHLQVNSVPLEAPDTARVHELK